MDSCSFFDVHFNEKSAAYSLTAWRVFRSNRSRVALLLRILVSSTLSFAFSKEFAFRGPSTYSDFLPRFPPPPPLPAFFHIKDSIKNEFLSFNNFLQLSPAPPSLSIDSLAHSRPSSRLRKGHANMLVSPPLFSLAIFTSSFDVLEK